MGHFHEMGGEILKVSKNICGVTEPEETSESFPKTLGVCMRLYGNGNGNITF